MSAPASMTYDPNGVVVVFSGIVLHGYGPDTFVTISRDQAAFKKQVGADGEVARVRNRNRSGTCKLVLQQTSQSNDALSAQAALDEQGGGGYGSLAVKDLNGTTLCSAGVAWIQKVADVGMGAELATREWIFDLDDVKIFAGSNA